MALIPFTREIGIIRRNLPGRLAGPKGQWKLAGGANHRIWFKKETRPGGAQELSVGEGFRRPFRGEYTWLAVPVVGTTG